MAFATLLSENPAGYYALKYSNFHFHVQQRVAIVQFLEELTDDITQTDLDNICEFFKVDFHIETQILINQISFDWSVIGAVSWEDYSLSVHLDSCYADSETFTIQTLQAFGIDIDDDSDLAIVTKLAVCAYTSEYFSVGSYSLYDINVFFYGYFNFYLEWFSISG